MAEIPRKKGLVDLGQQPDENVELQSDQPTSGGNQSSLPNLPSRPRSPKQDVAPAAPKKGVDVAGVPQTPLGGTTDNVTPTKTAGVPASPTGSRGGGASSPTTAGGARSNTPTMSQGAAPAAAPVTPRPVDTEAVGEPLGELPAETSGGSDDNTTDPRDLYDRLRDDDKEEEPDEFEGSEGEPEPENAEGGGSEGAAENMERGEVGEAAGGGGTAAGGAAGAEAAGGAAAAEGATAAAGGAAAGAEAAGAGTAAVATSEFWVPLAIIVLIVLLLGIILFVVIVGISGSGGGARPSANTEQAASGELGVLSGTPKEIIDNQVIPLAKQLGFDISPESVASANAAHGPTVNGTRSDHQGPPNEAWAADISNGGSPTKEMDELAQKLAAAFGVKEWQGGCNSNVKDGYRIQVIYRTDCGGNHYNHVHIGIRKQ